MGGGEIVLRKACPEDAAAIAELMVVAGGGLFEFLLEDLVPGKTPADLLAMAIADEAGAYSHRNVLVAEADGRVAGMINAYPADLMKADQRDLLPVERLEHISPLDEIQAWGSFFVSAMAVASDQRRRGIGRRLLGWACEQAERQGFDRISLQVWADNKAARRLYESVGFVVEATARIDPHPRLRRAGESLLMVRRI